MKDFTDCPDFSFLSQFFDQELEKQEADKIRQHLETCPECRAKGERLERMEATVRGVLSKSLSRLPPPAPSQECLSPEIISGYIQRTLPAEDGARAEKHLQACDACLNEVIEAFQISSSLASAKREPVLATLKARVASLWASPPGEEKTVSFPRLVIQIAQKGLRLLEQHLVSPLLDVQEILVPLPAYRSAEGPAALNLRINTGQAEIRTTAVQEGEGVALKMTFR
ncbi:MAG: zf-HC2 domain-containing protein, partial [Deltaproteobacteria bacterium]|nr:zf-HC2 domain-containing protein [Deltaproteobacteria bacterium]